MITKELIQSANYHLCNTDESNKCQCGITEDGRLCFCSIELLELISERDELKRQVEELTKKTSLEGFRAMAKQTSDALDERDAARSQLTTANETIKTLTELTDEMDTLLRTALNDVTNISEYTKLTRMIEESITSYTQFKDGQKKQII